MCMAWQARCHIFDLKRALRVALPSPRLLCWGSWALQLGSLCIACIILCSYHMKNLYGVSRICTDPIYALNTFLHQFSGPLGLATTAGPCQSFLQLPECPSTTNRRLSPFLSSSAASQMVLSLMSSVPPVSRLITCSLSAPTPICEKMDMTTIRILGSCKIAFTSPMNSSSFSVFACARRGSAMCVNDGKTSRIASGENHA